MTDLVDQMFPPIHRNWVNDFTDFNYWKDPVVRWPRRFPCTRAFEKSCISILRNIA